MEKARDLTIEKHPLMYYWMFFDGSKIEALTRQKTPTFNWNRCIPISLETTFFATDPTTVSKISCWASFELALQESGNFYIGGTTNNIFV